MSESPETDAIESMRPLAVAAAASASQAARIAQRMAERSADRARAQAEQERQLEELRREARGAYRELARREDWIGSASREDLAEAADVLGRGGDPRDRDALRRIEESGRDRFGADWRGTDGDQGRSDRPDSESAAEELTARAEEAERAAAELRERAEAEQVRAAEAREEGREDDAKRHEGSAADLSEQAAARSATGEQARGEASGARDQGEGPVSEQDAQATTSTSDLAGGEGSEQRGQSRAKTAGAEGSDHSAALPDETGQGAQLPVGAGAPRPGLRWAQGRARLGSSGGATGWKSRAGRDNEAER
jgi:colicin import membrane protein